jgi:uncharacterized protein
LTGGPREAVAVVPDRLSIAQARRLALTAQGFADPRPAGAADIRRGRRLFDRVGLIQIDSVNVLVRSQELPVFARLGPHRRDLLPRMLDRRELFEFWAHEASLLPVEAHPLIRWRMDAVHEGKAWGGVVRLARDEPAYIADVLAQVRERGPLVVGDLDDPGQRSPGMWGWNRGKVALEYLFWTGQVSARRRTNFERVYDLTERLLPAEILARPTPSKADAMRESLMLAARSLGVATAADLCDYYRLNRPLARPLVAELVEDGRLVPVEVEGWRHPTYLHPDAQLRRWVRGRALLSPFDSLVWDRDRTERLFGFRYRIEIYVPKAQRTHGYYVLPFLLDDRLVARVDLKADRAAGTLLVQAAHIEPGAEPRRVVTELAAELVALAEWLGLGGVRVAGGGELAPDLRAELARRDP